MSVCLSVDISKYTIQKSFTQIWPSWFCIQIYKETLLNSASLPNSRFNQNLEGSIFAWLFVVVVVETLRLSRREQTRLSPDQTRPDQTRPDLPDTAVDFPDTMLGLPDTMVDLPDTMVDRPVTRVDLSDTKVDLLDTMVDVPDTMVDLPDYMF